VQNHVPRAQPEDGQLVKLITGSSCELAVSFYPLFAYNASSGTGVGPAQLQADGTTSIAFDPESIYIPPLDFRSTRVLGLPIPPPLQIAIDAKTLQVTIFLNPFPSS
jgi:hypothetical protein